MRFKLLGESLSKGHLYPGLSTWPVASQSSKGLSRSVSRLHCLMPPYTQGWDSRTVWGSSQYPFCLYRWLLFSDAAVVALKMLACSPYQLAPYLTLAEYPGHPSSLGLDSQPRMKLGAPSVECHPPEL